MRSRSLFFAIITLIVIVGLVCPVQASEFNSAAVQQEEVALVGNDIADNIVLSKAKDDAVNFAYKYDNYLGITGTDDLGGSSPEIVSDAYS